MIHCSSSRKRKSGREGQKACWFSTGSNWPFLQLSLLPSTHTMETGLTQAPGFLTSVRDNLPGFYFAVTSKGTQGKNLGQSLKSLGTEWERLRDYHIPVLRSGGRIWDQITGRRNIAFSVTILVSFSETLSCSWGWIWTLNPSVSISQALGWGVHYTGHIWRLSDISGTSFYLPLTLRTTTMLPHCTPRRRKEQEAILKEQGVGSPH